MDEKSIKDHLRDLKQRSGLTLTNIREHQPLWEALSLDGPEALRSHIIECLAKLDGTREGATLRQAYNLFPDGPPSSLATRRDDLAKQWKMSVDTIKRYERSGIDQLYLWMFPPDLSPSEDFEKLDSPIEIDMTQPDSTTSLFQANGRQLAVTQEAAPDAGPPKIDFWFDEEYIDSGRKVVYFYIPPIDDDAHSTLQFQFGDVAVLIKFQLEGQTSAIRFGFSGPARPSQVMHGPIPHPSDRDLESKLDRSGWKVGATNGAFLGLLYDERPTVSTLIVLSDFVEEWKDDVRDGMIRSGLLLPIFEVPAES
jgi:hypothetical protein